MSNKYLLPCRCGEKTPIEPRQAGEEIVCQCGARLQAPTMLEIKALEPVPVAAGASVAGLTSWGWRQALKLLSVLLFLTAIIFGGWFFYTRPIAISDVLPPEVLQNSASKLTPNQTWTSWQMYKQGLDRRTNTKYMTERTRYHIWMTVCGVLALVGVGLFAIGAIRPRPIPSG